MDDGVSVSRTVRSVLAFAVTVAVTLVLQTLAARNPSYRLSESDVPPRLVALYADVRRRQAHAQVTEAYANAKAAFDAGRYADASLRFGTVLALLTTHAPVLDPNDAGAVARVLPGENLSVLKSAFSRLKSQSTDPRNLAVTLDPAGDTATVTLVWVAQAAGAEVASSSAAPSDAAVDGLGRVRIASAIPLQVVERGRVIGTSGDRALRLSPGTHTLELSNSTLGFHTTERVRVDAGQQAELPVALPTGTVNVNAQPWAQVLIDGAVVGDTPLANVPLVIGDHEVVWRHPQFGERRQQVVVKAGALTRISASFAP